MDNREQPPGEPGQTPPPAAQPYGLPDRSAWAPDPPTWPPGAAQWTVAAIAVVLAGGMIAFRLLNDIGLGQTAALYIGLPTVLAVALTLTPRAGSAKGMAVKGVAIGVLLSGIVLGEGLVCILMASPLFFLIALLVGYSMDRARERRGAARVLLAVPLLLSVMSLEGVTDATSLPRDEVVTVTRMVAAGPAEVEAALARTPSFDRERPLFLRLGFPQPLGASGEGLDVGDRRTVLLSRHARHYPHHHGTLVLEVADRAEGRATFRVVEDTTPIASWVRWREADVSWEQAAPGRTRVTWSLRYRRMLDPAWYFGPMQRYANQLTASYLIDTLATPAGPPGPRTPGRPIGLHSGPPGPRTPGRPIGLYSGPGV